MKLVVREDPVYVRRRRVAAVVVLVVLTLLVLGVVRACQALTEDDRPSPAEQAVAAQRDAFDVSGTRLVARRRISGDINPKSVAASRTGTVLAQNMMYRHTMTAYGADGTLRATLPDAVDLATFGVKGAQGVVRGAPVEAAWLRDGSKAYVSNYSMYGPGFAHEGKDSCTDKTTVDASYLYRVDAGTLKVDQVIRVGAVPKVVAITPDQRTILATNWCSGTLSVVDAATAKETRTVRIGAHPRGIAVSPDSRTAYVAEMGGETVYAVSLADGTATPLVKPGKGPRALVLSADGRHLYVTNNDSDTLVRVDVQRGAVDKSVALPDQPRSMTISADGRALYVVSYGASTLTKVRTSDLTVQQSVGTDHQPIGVTYEPTRNAVWVSCYQGSILVLDESRNGSPAPAPASTGPSSTSTGEPGGGPGGEAHD